MTASRNVTIWCNGCGTWTSGGAHTAADARAEARTEGWRTGVPGTHVIPEDSRARSLFRPGDPRDFCPDCKESIPS